ncbi:transketolase [Sporosalibacterium faouarense]|uniref:transketolase n=1 Tax=Sporosalibacterium faouarense TaxID=516123 RepID=UPI00192BBCBD|nr:transketolase [Sporosalibacterium faouarense]
MEKVEQKVVDTIRFLAVDGVEKANSGHPGMPMGAAPMAHTLWSKFLKGSGKDPNWADRDRFVLSAGHGSMLIYSLLHLYEYDVNMDDLKNFRQWGSKTPGHPEYGHTPGVETTTGPLGQGISTAVGMALAERRVAAEFNTEDFSIVDHYTYVIAGDGDLMEGVSSEAASLAGHLKLGKLIVMYDDNNITIDGTTKISFTEDVGQRFEAYGWEVISVKDSNDIDELEAAIARAKKNTSKPTLIKVPTTIGFGSPNKAGKSSAHGSPLGKDEVNLTKEGLGWNTDEDFYVPQDVREYMDKIIVEKEEERQVWEKRFKEYRSKYPEKARAWDIWHSENVPAEAFEDEELFEFDEKLATRAAGGQVMNVLAKNIPNLMGGSADLNASTKTYLKGKGDFQAEDPTGNNVNFGVREHGMGAILNGMSLHGGLRVFGSTFLVFSDYMKPAIRLSGLMKQPVTYIFTHDSIGLGEDGPTHQPIEHLLMLRSIPNVTVFRPADAKESAVAWTEALKRTDGPSVLVFSRQGLPTLDEIKEDAHKGGYVLVKEEKDTPDAILIGSGSEVSLLVEAHDKLKKEGIDTRVVSMLSWELFDQQSGEYKNEVLPKAITKRLSCEAGTTIGWRKYVGSEGVTIGIDGFGASAPGNVLMKEFGFTVENVVKNVRGML